MKKRAASLLLALCMILTLLPATAGAVNTETKQVVVMGTDVTAGGYWIVNAFGLLTSTTEKDNWNVAYSPSSGSVGTLTLKNVTLAVSTEAARNYYSYSNAYFGACIWTRGSLIIECIGDNLINLEEISKIDGDCAGIAIGTDVSWLTFKGDGDLTVKGGPATGNSYGLIAPFSVKMEGTGVLTFLGGECGSNGISAGIRSRATLDDLGAYIEPGPGTVIAGTKSGGAGSYGIYGKLAFPKFDRYLGRFTAYCGEAESAMALSIPPISMPVGNVALAGSDDASGRNLEPYRTENNAMFHYVTTLTDLKTGARLSDLAEDVDARTSYTLTMVEPTILGDNPGGQVVEYAVGATGTVDRPTTGWQTDPVFIGLAPNTKYVVWARTAATLEYAAGTPVTFETRTNLGGDFTTGLLVDGIGIDRSMNFYGLAIGGGTADYNHNTHTLTFYDTVSITHGCTLPNGEAAGIYSSGDLNIVLADGAQVTIDLVNYERDMDLLKAQETSNHISGNCYGIICADDLTISAAENCISTPKLTIRVQGSGRATGIRAVGSEKLNIRGDITVGQTAPVDVDITVRGISASPTLSTAIASRKADGSPYVAAMASGKDIILCSGTITAATIDGYRGTIFSTGNLNMGYLLPKGATIYAKNDALNGTARVTRNYITFDESDCYIVLDENGDYMGEDDVWYLARSATFLPGRKQTLTGTLVIEGAARVGSTLTAVLQDSNASGSFTYTWYYRHKDDSSRHGMLTGKGNQLTLRDNELNDYIYCTVTARGFNGSLTSEEVGPVTVGVFPALYVDSERVTSSNFEDVLGDGTVSYDVDTLTLSLNNAALNAAHKRASAVIYQDDDRDLTIVLTGSNSITAPSSKVAIYTKGDLHITGDGTLNTSTSGSASDYLIKAQSGTGTTTVLKDLLLDGSCTVNISSPHYGISADNVTFAENSAFTFTISVTNTYGRGIHSTGTLLVRDNAVVSSTAGSYQAIDAMSVEINGGSVSAKNSGTSGGTGSYPAFTAADITVNGGLLEASSESKYAIQATSLTLNRGRVEASSISYTAIQLRSAFNLNGGTLIAKNNSGAPFKGLKSVLKNSAPASIYYKSANSDGSDKEVITSTWDFGKTEYHYIELTTEFPPEVTAVTTGSGVTVSVKTDGQQQYLFIARFDSTGHLLELQQRLRGEEAILKAEFTFPTVSPTDRFTVFLLDDGCAPIHGAVTASGS